MTEGAVEQQVGAKRKRNDDEEACMGFLEEFAALPLEGMQSDEVVNQAKELYSRIEEHAKSSPYLAELLAGA